MYIYFCHLLQTLSGHKFEVPVICWILFIQQMWLNEVFCCRKCILIVNKKESFLVSIMMSSFPSGSPSALNQWCYQCCGIWPACIMWNLNGDSSCFPDLSFMTERAREQCVSVQFVFSSDQLVFKILCVEWWQWKEWAGPWPYSGFQFCCLSPVDKPDSSKGVP